MIIIAQVRSTMTKIEVSSEHNKAPHWNDHFQRYYVWGKKWIRTKQKFSGNVCLHNFKSFVELKEG